MTNERDLAFMRSALAMAERGLGRTWPNPSVGCVIEKDGRTLARSRTADTGRPHAETQALETAGQSAAGATTYVTLEPCSHTGQTPPCANALVEAKIARCVISIPDPDPKVSGRGIDMLQSAGIEVSVGTLAEDARRQLGGYLMQRTAGRPAVTLKLASSLDGRIATRSGESRWITSSAARRHVHHLRATHDAVLVGIGTALADDPMLDVRDQGEIANPLRIVLDSQLRLPGTSRLARSAKVHPVWIIHREDAEPDRQMKLADAGCHLVPCGTLSNGRLDLADAFQSLGDRGLTKVLCEGGGAVAASLVEHDLVDRLYQFTAGKFIGGDGHPAIGSLGVEALAQAPAFELDTVNACGPDTLATFRRIDRSA